MTCPHCGWQSAWKNGHRHGFQRWLCRNCGREYLDRVQAKGLSSAQPNLLLVGAGEKQAERLVGVQTDTEKGGNVEKCEQISRNSGLLKKFPESLQPKILEFAVKRESQGFKDAKAIALTLRRLIRNGADLYDPESVKQTLKNLQVSESSKWLYSLQYEAFFKFLGGVWERPNYQAEEKIPFIPTEAELEQLITALGPVTSTFCQIAKETFARRGEIAQLKWTDIDFERRIITINDPEKRSKPRMMKVSEKCISMVSQLPRRSERVFKNLKSIVLCFFTQRKRASIRYNNPRFLEIGFHTFRHWGATMLYHKVHDLEYVQQALGHKSILNTMIYITIERALFGEGLFDEFTVKVANNVEEACKLVEVGFEYICEYGDAKIFRKRK